MRRLDTIRPGLSLSDLEASLRTDGVEPQLEQSLFADQGPTLEFADRGWNYQICFDASRRVDSRAAWCTLPEDRALELIEEIAGREASLSAAMGSESIGWRTPRRIMVLGLRAGESSVHLRCDMEPGAELRTCLASTVYLDRLTELEPVLASAPIADGPRGAAVDRLRAHLTGRRAVLARLAQIIQRVTPVATIVEEPLARLEEHVRWCAAHDTMFSGAEDWRDALVVGGGKIREIPHRDPEDFGWTVEIASECIDRSFGPEGVIVRLVEGPFAFGIHRVHRTAHELHPIQDGWPIDEVVIQDPAALLVERDPDWLRRYDPEWLRGLGARIATLDGTEVVVTSVNGDVERIARLLASARVATRPAL